MTYEEELDIDDESLDIECLEQPQLVLRYSKLVAQSKLEMDDIKEDLDLVRAQIDIEVRTNPQDFGIDKGVKITEAVINGTIIQQEDWQKANNTYLKAQYEYSVLKGAITACEHRKTSLELLVKLYNGQYFAGPSVPRDLKAERERKQVKADIAVGKRIKRTKK